VNPTTYVAANTTTLFTITGVITTFTNLTSGNTASYYIQDSTGGLNLFVTSGSTFRPEAGDVVTATGTLSVYDDNLEIDVNYASAVATATIVTNSSGIAITNALPAPILLPFGYAAANPTTTFTDIEGSRVILTNAYFETPGVDFVAGTTYTVSNNAGLTYTVFLSAQDTNLNTTLVPAFAWSIAAPLIQDDAVYELELTDPSEIVSAPPSAVTVSASSTESGGTNAVTLHFAAVPYDYTYSVLASTNVAGPYTPVASGLIFTNASASYTAPGSTNMTEFYEIVSP
jgi:hypothetical protein